MPATALAELHALPRIRPAALRIPVDPSSCAMPVRQAWRDRARVKAAMGRWADLSHIFRTEDRKRSAAPDGTPVTTLLAMGVRDAFAAPALAGPGLLQRAETLQAELGNDYVHALLLALAHMDAGLAWRGTAPRAAVPPERLSRFKAHFDRATTVLDGIDPFEVNSAAVAAARCTALYGAADAPARVADDFEDVIDLDPMNPLHMRALGTYLLPRWWGSHARIEQEARRTMARTRDLWGRGAYAWVWLDALALDPAAAEELAPELFLDAVHDILARASDPRAANIFAAFAAIAMRPCPLQPEGRARDARARLHGATSWILREHVSALHPAPWAEMLNGLAPCDSSLRRLRRATLPSQEAMRHFVRSLASHMPEGIDLEVVTCDMAQSGLLLGEH